MTDTANDPAATRPPAPGGTYSFEVADQAHAEALADALANFGFPLVFGGPHRDGRWQIIIVDAGPYPPGISGHRALDAAHRQAILLAHSYGGHPAMRGYSRADKLATTAPAAAPIVRTNPGARPPITIAAMVSAPPTRKLALHPDVFRPGPVDLRALDGLPWDQLDHAYPDDDIPALVRQLVAAPDTDWPDLFWSDLMTALVHQGTCYSATPAMVPVLAQLAVSTSLSARRRADLHLALLDLAGRVAADLVYDADHAAVDDRTPQAQHWATEAHTAVGATAPALLAHWPQQPPAIQFTLAALAGLYPEHSTAIAAEADALASEYAGTQQGAYLKLASALRQGDDNAALTIAREITRWNEDTDPDWLDAPGLPARITCGHLLAEGVSRIANTTE
jgi:hypothetical protein